ncbi:hypothetical protein BDR22DRAFT_826699 [Usnea florida]
MARSCKLRDMTPPEKGLLPDWRAFARRRPAYAPLDVIPGSDAIEIPRFSSQTSSSPTCIDCSNADLNKALPKPPSRIHFIRHNLVSRHYHRLRKLQGYHFGVLWCAGVAALVLIINLILTIWAVAKLGVQDGFGTLYDGSCKRTTSLTFWLHLAINVLSTLLLGASNYSMQCLSSPTRSEIDKAHSQGIWLDIGVPSVRNLRRLSTTRIVLWWLLALSSIPLHLLYNSAVFSTLSTRSYDSFLVTSDFLNGGYFNTTEAGSSFPSNYIFPFYWQSKLQYYSNNQTSLVKMENKHCVETYTAPIISTHSDLLLVSSDLHATNSLLSINIEADSQLIIDVANQQAGDGGSTPSTFCTLGLNCDSAGALANPQNLSFITSDLLKSSYNHVNGTIPELSYVEYCLSRPVAGNCKLQFSVTIMIVVIICNMIKTVCMTTVSWKQDPEPLVTLGDAIASFLDRPDVATKQNCMAGRTRFEKSRYWGLLLSRWDSNRFRWFRAASRRRWIVCNMLCISTLTATGVLLHLGLDNVYLSSRSIPHLWSLGFGNVNPETLITINHKEDLSGPTSVIATVLIANSPQILLSFLYFAYNGIFTCMLLAEEWNLYATKRNFLRVTSPAGGQRSTYRLQLPYRYGVPLLIGSSMLHWFVSQSIFLARVNEIGFAGEGNETYTGPGNEETEIHGQGVSTCGYSPLAMIFVIILGSIVVLLGICFGFRKSRGGMPLAGSCSAAISAACHPPEADVNASLKRVMWGVVAEDSFQYEGESVGHCSFTSSKVEAPVVGKWYAGL